MRRLYAILMIAALFLTAFDFVPFGPPTRWPENLDQLHAFIEAGERGYVWSECSPGEAVHPFVTWEMVQEIEAVNMDNHQSRVIVTYADLQQILQPGGVVVPDTGILDASEEDIFWALLIEFASAGYLSCGDAEGKPILYGPGVQRIFDRLAGNIRQ